MVSVRGYADVMGMSPAWLGERTLTGSATVDVEKVKRYRTTIKEFASEKGDDNGYYKRRREKSSGTQIQLILVDGLLTHFLNIGSSTTLRTLFNDYAEKRGISLRSLRFTYDEKTLFLSSIGNTTPDELNMVNQDVITVHNTKILHESGNIGYPTKIEPTYVRSQKRNNSTKKKKDRGKKEQRKQEEPIKTLAECKASHSRILSKLHEEVQSKLKGIRMRLNTLDLKQQTPKQKRKNKTKKKTQKNVVDHQMMFRNYGIGGKAGKPYFAVHVGEVENLFKTTKPSRNVLYSASTLDLHGYTRDEALLKLNKSLPAWVDIAMKGSYPFVIPVMIVCGCGNQVLSETVEKWIRGHAQVANSPKGLL